MVERDAPAAVASVNANDVAAELVSRMLLGEPLLPFAPASQDMGMLAYAIDKMGAQIARVRELHVAFATGYCQECAKDYPCPTIEALEGKP